MSNEKQVELSISFSYSNSDRSKDGKESITLINMEEWLEMSLDKRHEHQISILGEFFEGEIPWSDIFWFSSTKGDLPFERYKCHQCENDFIVEKGEEMLSEAFTGRSFCSDACGQKHLN